jgi:raffinose/stachyose/melibiose transport system permease protein
MATTRTLPGPAATAPLDGSTLPGRPRLSGAETSRPRKGRGGGPPGAPRRVAYLYLLPALLLYLVFVVGPLLHTVWLSLFDWDGVTVGTWTGLTNYVDALGDPSIRQMFGRSLVLIAFYSVVPISVGLFLTAILSFRRLAGLTFYRAVLFVPQIVSLIVVSVAWQWMYADTGVVNEGLRGVGLGSVARAWLGDFTWSLSAIGLIGAWLMTGLCMVFFLSGVQKIDPDLYDAARVDGCGPVREFFAVTLPGLRNEIAVSLTFTVIAALRAFDLIFVLTKGGPGDATTVPGIEIYRRAFEKGQVGSASAIAVLLTAIIFAVTYAITRVVRER